jgi:hypothetical protein
MRESQFDELCWSWQIAVSWTIWQALPFVDNWHAMRSVFCKIIGRLSISHLLSLNVTEIKGIKNVLYSCVTSPKLVHIRLKYHKYRISLCVSQSAILSPRTLHIHWCAFEGFFAEGWYSKRQNYWRICHTHCNQRTHLIKASFCVKV